MGTDFVLQVKCTIFWLKRGWRVHLDLYAPDFPKSTSMYLFLTKVVRKHESRCFTAICHFWSLFNCFQPLCIGAIIHTSREIHCLPHAGFLKYIIYALWDENTLVTQAITSPLLDNQDHESIIITIIITIIIMTIISMTPRHPISQRQELTADSVFVTPRPPTPNFLPPCYRKSKKSKNVSAFIL